MELDRPSAEALLFEWTKSPGLRAHARAVEAALCAYARKYGEDEALWGVTGLLQAILGHAQYLNVPRDTRLAQALFAVDELVGLITAVALVNPAKDIRQVKPRSIRKKWKDKNFAKGVNRADVELGASELGVPLEEHIAFTLEAMQGAAEDLGLDGSRAG